MIENENRRTPNVNGHIQLQSATHCHEHSSYVKTFDDVE